jgi:hypothetical protein
MNLAGIASVKIRMTGKKENAWPGWPGLPGRA